MNEAVLRELAIWLLVPSVAVIALIGLVVRIGTPAAIRRRRRERQTRKLTALLRTRPPSNTLIVNWIDYRELSKDRLRALFAEHDWQLSTQEITDRGWLLTCTRTAESR
ncbi:hypothetical protein EV191_110215 [Tamaricihabitans halophyticus]|uniref:Uncharacterized protein n=1 Tax=Tamaricihabitans halophyticus TaxID=1262583 RepID=A0A4R2QIX6_9PSEU|nr:hypothetical protein [Tamaricihabitans halophyticus]TCP48654.1 hypothetical protein EV191_110215 [Tamaricihabitans halophyticus]